MFLIIILGACENYYENPKQNKTSPTDSVYPNEMKKEIIQEIEESDTLDFVPVLDSLKFDTLTTTQDSLSFENETHVLPVPKPTFKIFFKYMKLHSKAPIV